MSIDEARGVDVHLLGRRLYETMLCWETADEDPSLSDAEREWTALWNGIPKVVFSRTLTEVQGNARLGGDLVDEVERLRAELGDGEIAIGGANPRRCAWPAERLMVEGTNALSRARRACVPHCAGGDRDRNRRCQEVHNHRSAPA